MRQYLIYALEEPLTGEVRYVGRSSQYLYRPKNHWQPGRKERNHCSKWAHRLVREGREPKIVVLEECPEEILDKAEINKWLNEKEVFWIEFYLNRGERLTNHSLGGAGNLGYKPSEETLEKARGKKHSEESKNRISQANTGKTRSTEQKEKIKASIKGKTKTAYSKPIRCLNDGKVFSCLKEAAEFYSIGMITVRSICVKQTKKSRSGLMFEYVYDSPQARTILIGQNV